MVRQTVAVHEDKVNQESGGYTVHVKGGEEELRGQFVF